MLKRSYITLLILLTTIPLWASDFDLDGIKYYTNGTKAIVDGLTAGKEYTGPLTIPETVDFKNTTYTVTSIRSSAFQGCTGLTQVTIPNSVTYIGEYAFQGCTGLTQVTIPNSVTSIEKNAFSDCTGLMSIPNSLPIIGESMFSGCTGLNQVSIPSSVTSIGKNAFNGCTGLTEVTIPNSVTSISYNAFSDCTGLKKVIIEDGESSLWFWGTDAFSGTTIEDLHLGRDMIIIHQEKSDSPFYSISSLSQLTIGNTVTFICQNAFSGCTSLKKVIIEDGERNLSIASDGFKDSPIEGLYLGRNVSEWSFDSMSSLSKITIGNTVTTISKYVFNGCTGLTEVTIPNSVITIGEYAFNGCTGLTEVTIPNSVTTIGEYAFQGCSSLAQVTIPNSVTVIETGTFKECTGLAQVAIPNTVTSIGRSAFLGCSSLAEVAIPNSVTSIGEYAFQGCSSLAEVAIPNSVTSIRSSAFQGCTGLTQVTIPNSVTYIGEYAFQGCSSLAKVTIPPTVKYIQEYAFQGCSSLAEVAIPNSVTSIGEYAFQGCSSLTKVTIPPTVKYIQEYTFSGCSSLTEVTIHNTVTSIGTSAFEGCTSLKNVEIEDGKGTLTFENNVFLDVPIEVLYLGRNVSGISFNSNSSLSKLTIGNAIITINDCAFQDCTSLTEVTIPNSVTSIGNNAFNGCSSLNEVIIHNTVTSIGTSAFEGCTSLKIVMIEEGIRALTLNDSVFKGAPIEVLYLGRNLSCPSTSVVPFYEKSSLSKLTISTSVTNLGDYSFKGCTGLKNVLIEDGESTLAFGKEVFEKAPIEVLHLGRKFTRPSTTSEKPPFCSKPSLSKLTIGNAITTIGENEFSRCTGLTQVTIPNSVTTIGASAFYSCSSLTEVAIPNSVTTVGKSAFDSCTGLTQVTIPNSVTSIGKYAFSGCTSLAQVNIPSSVTTIGQYAFSGCTGLKDLKIEDGESTLNFERPVFANTSIETLYIGRNITNVSEASFTLFFNKSSLSKLTISNTVTYISNYEFYGCSGLTEVTIPNSVTSIGKYAFYMCTGLAEMTIPNSVTTINDSAFKECTELKNVVIEDGKSTLSINDDIFINVPIETLYLGRNFTCSSDHYLLKKPFYSKSSLSRLTIGNEVTTIGEYEFSKCTGLTEVSIPNSVTEIGNYAFDGCTSMKNVVIEDGKSTLTINDNIFINVPIETLYLGRNFTCSSKKLPEKPFISMSSLSKLTIGNTVTTIGKYAFNGCTGLTELTIPNSVTVIDEHAFGCCTGLTEVIFGDSLTTIGQSAFWDCKELKSVIIPASVTSIESYNFWDCVKAAIPPYCHFNISNVFSSKAKLIYYDPYNCVIDRDKIIYDGKREEILYVSTAYKGDYEIPATIERIGENAFMYCDKITSISALPTFAPANYENSFEGLYETVPLDIPEGTTLSYYSTGFWHLFTKVFSGDVEVPTTNVGGFSYVLYSSIEEAQIFGINEKTLTNVEIPARVKIGDTRYNVTMIGPNVFKGMSSLKEITFCPGIKVICENAFSHCTSLDNVVLPQNLTSIALGTFNSCTSLKEITIPKNVVKIEESAFDLCSSLTKVTFEGNLKSIGNKAFNGCPIENIEFPNSLQEIGHYAFCNTKLMSIEFPKGLKSIGENAFGGNQFKQVVIPPSIVNIGTNAFEKCASLKDFIIPEGVNPIALGSSIFGENSTSSTKESTKIENLYIGRNCDNWTSFNELYYLQKLSIGNNVTEILDEAFKGNYNLKSLTLGGNLTSIGESAFQNCTSLKEVIIPRNVTSIGNKSFYNCSRINQIAIGCGIEQIGEEAFYGVNNVEKISVAALTPPEANDNSFSKYNALLYLPLNSIEDYDDNGLCWSTFFDYKDPYELTEINAITLAGTEKICDMTPGQTVKITASIQPQDATLPYIFWRSTNPDIITVDVDGNITFYGFNNTNTSSDVAPTECKIIAETMYADGPVATVTVSKYGTGLKVDVEDYTTSHYILGDANADAKVSTADIVTMVQYILGNKPDTFIFAAADINSDNKVSSSDITGVIDIILSEEVSSRVAMYRNGPSKEAHYSISSLDFDNQKCIAQISFNKATETLATQFDLILPEGLILEDIQLSRASQNYAMAYRQVADNCVRVIAYSLNNQCFAQDVMFDAIISGESVSDDDPQLVITRAYYDVLNSNNGIEELEASGCSASLNELTSISDIELYPQMRIYTEGHTLVIESPVAKRMVLSNVSGQCRVLNVKAGINRFHVAESGLMMVNDHKVIIK